MTEAIKAAHKRHYEKMKKIMAANPELHQKHLDMTRRWRHKNPDKVKNYSKKYYAENKKSVLLKRDLWGKANPLYLKKSDMIKRTHLPIAIETIQKIYEANIKRHGTLTCYLCLEPIEFKQDCLEHKIPSKRGGDNSESNLGVAHNSCNNKKRNLTESEYREKIGVNGK